MYSAMRSVGAWIKGALADFASPQDHIPSASL